MLGAKPPIFPYPLKSPQDPPGAGPLPQTGLWLTLLKLVPKLIGLATIIQYSSSNVKGHSGPSEGLSRPWASNYIIVVLRLKTFSSFELHQILHPTTKFGLRSSLPRGQPHGRSTHIFQLCCLTRRRSCAGTAGSSSSLLDF